MRRYVIQFSLIILMLYPIAVSALDPCEGAFEGEYIPEVFEGFQSEIAPPASAADVEQIAALIQASESLNPEVLEVVEAALASNDLLIPLDPLHPSRVRAMDAFKYTLGYRRDKVFEAVTKNDLPRLILIIELAYSRLCFGQGPFTYFSPEHLSLLPVDIRNLFAIKFFGPKEAGGTAEYMLTSRQTDLTDHQLDVLQSAAGLTGNPSEIMPDEFEVKSADMQGWGDPYTQDEFPFHEEESDTAQFWKKPQSPNSPAKVAPLWDNYAFHAQIFDELKAQTGLFNRYLKSSNFNLYVARFLSYLMKPFNFRSIGNEQKLQSVMQIGILPNVSQVEKEYLHEVIKNSKDTYIRAQAALILGKVGDFSSIGFLLEQLQTDNLSKYVRIAVSIALGQLQVNLDPRFKIERALNMRLNNALLNLTPFNPLFAATMSVSRLAELFRAKLIKSEVDSLLSISSLAAPKVDVDVSALIRQLKSSHRPTVEAAFMALRYLGPSVVVDLVRQRNWFSDRKKQAIDEFIYSYKELGLSKITDAVSSFIVSDLNSATEVLQGRPLVSLGLIAEKLTERDLPESAKERYAELLMDWIDQDIEQVIALSISKEERWSGHAVLHKTLSELINFQNYDRVVSYFRANFFSNAADREKKKMLFFLSSVGRIDLIEDLIPRLLNESDCADIYKRNSIREFFIELGDLSVGPLVEQFRSKPRVSENIQDFIIEILADIRRGLASHSDLIPMIDSVLKKSPDYAGIHVASLQSRLSQALGRDARSKVEAEIIVELKRGGLLSLPAMIKMYPRFSEAGRAALADRFYHLGEKGCDKVFELYPNLGLAEKVNVYHLISQNRDFVRERLLTHLRHLTSELHMSDMPESLDFDYAELEIRKVDIIILEARINDFLSFLLQFPEAPRHMLDAVFMDHHVNSVYEKMMIEAALLVDNEFAVNYLINAATVTSYFKIRVMSLLHYSNSERVIEPLLFALKENVINLNEAAIVELRKMGPEKVALRLIDYLNTKRTTQQSYEAALTLLNEFLYHPIDAELRSAIESGLARIPLSNPE